MRNAKTELDKVSAGKTTMKSLFKSKSQKETNILQLQASIEQCEEEIADYKKLTHFLTIYHAQFVIPQYKTQKIKVYFRMLNNFCIKEISNAHLTATLYHGLLNLEKKAPVEEAKAE